LNNFFQLDPLIFIPKSTKNYSNKKSHLVFLSRILSIRTRRRKMKEEKEKEEKRDFFGSIQK